MSQLKILPGRPYPLGANYDGRGTNFALFSRNAEKVELCLFDEKGKTEELVSGYSNIITFLFKMRTKRDYGYAAQNKEFIQSKFDEIKKLQAEMNDLFSGADNGGERN